MGYNTNFTGTFNLNKPLSIEHKAYLDAFSGTRRMKRDSELVSKLTDYVREAVNLPVGIDGEYYVGATGWSGQDHTEDILDYNNPPSDQPGLWCQWVPTADGMGIEWNEEEKFYEYVEWMEYLIKHFLSRWGYEVSGRVDWTGDDFSDRGSIWILKNVIKVVKNSPLGEEPDWGDSIPEPTDEVDIAPNPIEDVIAEALSEDEK